VTTELTTPLLAVCLRGVGINFLVIYHRNNKQVTLEAKCQYDNGPVYITYEETAYVHSTEEQHANL
jgi:hypothetical protein